MKDRRTMHRWATLARRWGGVGLLAAAALTLRADVLVLKNGTLLLGRPVATTADSVSLAIGAAGTVTVRLANIRQVIPCPPAEEPDSYLKAALRAERNSWFAEAFACLEKSVTAEPATAAVAQAQRAALQQHVLADAKVAATAKPQAGGQPMGEMDRQQVEAQRLIAEGEAQLKRAELAAHFDAKNRGPSARALQQQGQADMIAAQAKIDEGKEMLTKIEQVKAAAQLVPPPPALTIREQIIQWGWLIGAAMVGLVVLRFLLKPFFSSR